MFGFPVREEMETAMNYRVSRTARLAVTAGLTAALTVGSAPVLAFAEGSATPTVEQTPIENKVDETQVTRTALDEGDPGTAADPQEASVAQVGDRSYSTVSGAVEAAEAGATVTLLKDVIEDVVVPAGKIVTLDLAGCKLTNSGGHTITVGKNAGLTVVDSSSAKTGVVDNITHGKAALSVEEGSIVNLSGGTFKRSQEKGTIDYSTGATTANGNSYYTK